MTIQFLAHRLLYICVHIINIRFYSNEILHYSGIKKIDYIHSISKLWITLNFFAKRNNRKSTPNQEFFHSNWGFIETANYDLSFVFRFRMLATWWSNSLANSSALFLRFNFWLPLLKFILCFLFILFTSVVLVCTTLAKKLMPLL